jgi:hypothetical protein
MFRRFTYALNTRSDPQQPTPEATSVFVPGGELGRTVLDGVRFEHVLVAEGSKGSRRWVLAAFRTPTRPPI